MNKDSEFVRQNEWAIKAVLGKYHFLFDYEDLVQEAKFYLFTIRDKWNPKKSSWETYVCNMLNWFFKNYRRNYYTKTKEPSLSGYSVISTEMLNSEYNDNKESLLVSNYRLFTDELDGKMLYDSFIEGIKNEKIKDIVIQRLNGYTYKAIAQKYGVSKQYIQSIYSNEIKKIREKMLGMNRQKIYISGPMKGKIDLNRVEFYKAEKYLLGLGYIPINPFSLTKKLRNPSIEECMKLDIEAILKCDSVYLLNGWENSKGCAVELAVAKSIGLKILYQDKER